MWVITYKKFPLAIFDNLKQARECAIHVQKRFKLEQISIYEIPINTIDPAFILKMLKND